MDRYEETLSALFVRFPSVQKDGFTSGAYKPGLDNMLAFDRCLGCPASSLRTIHVAGTNGKGSVASMLASSLAASGYRVGLYTSPHLLDFRERIKIVSDDAVTMIPRQDVLAFVDRWSTEFDRLGLSFFEITTGMALDWFKQENVDVAVIEAGLGGRLDSTNIIEPELSIVTSIGLDHCALLGNTRAKIAAEKAGIFKPGVAALAGEHDEETSAVFEAAAQQVHCPLFYSDDWDEIEMPEMDLKGEYQNRNVRTVLAALDILGEDAELDAICHTAVRTGLHGRWEILNDKPLTICDIGHNPPALGWNFAQLRGMMSSGRYDKLIIIYGVMADKALGDIIALMPEEAVYVFTTPDTPRALDSVRILEQYRTVRPCASNLFITGSVAEALRKSRELATEDSLIYIGGSTFVVADALSR